MSLHPLPRDPRAPSGVLSSPELGAGWEAQPRPRSGIPGSLAGRVHQPPEGTPRPQAGSGLVDEAWPAEAAVFLGTRDCWGWERP